MGKISLEQNKLIYLILTYKITYSSNCMVLIHVVQSAPIATYHPEHAGRNVIL